MPPPIRFAHHARVSVFCLVNNLNEGARDNHVAPFDSASAARKSAARKSAAREILHYAEAVEIPIDSAARVGLFDKINPVFRPGSIVSEHQLVHGIPSSPFFSKFEDVICMPHAQDTTQAVLENGWKAILSRYETKVTVSRRKFAFPDNFDLLMCIVISSRLSERVSSILTLK